MKLHELWGYVKSIYLILYGGLVIPFGLLTALDDFGIHDRIAWNEDFTVLASIPLVLYGLVWLWRQERKECPKGILRLLRIATHEDSICRFYSPVSAHMGQLLSTHSKGKRTAQHTRGYPASGTLTLRTGSIKKLYLFFQSPACKQYPADKGSKTTEQMAAHTFTARQVTPDMPQGMGKSPRLPEQ